MQENKSCKWRDDFTWICFNGDSEMCTKESNSLINSNSKNFKKQKGLIMQENKSCKWRDDFTWICFNGDSEMCADVAYNDYCRECKLFEEKENE